MVVLTQSSFDCVSSQRFLSSSSVLAQGYQISEPSCSNPSQQTNDVSVSLMLCSPIPLLRHSSRKTKRINSSACIKTAQKRLEKPHSSLSLCSAHHYYLGFVFGYGYKTRIETSRAIFHFKQAIIRGGDPRAMMELATLYSKREIPNVKSVESRRRAFALARKSVSMGFKQANYLLWVMYDDKHATNLKEDECEACALKALRKAHAIYSKCLTASYKTDMPEPRCLSEFRLGCLYDFNTQSALGSVEETEEVAALFYQKSNLPTALNNLGCMYKRSSKIFQLSEQQKFRKAFDLFNEAADHRFSRAIHNLGNMYLNDLVSWETLSLEEKVFKAKSYFKRAVSHGLSSSLCDLGDLYKDYGRTVFRLSSQDQEKKACSYYLKGAERENPFCLKYLAAICLDGVQFSHLWHTNSDRIKKSFHWAFQAYQLEPHNKTVCEVLATCLIEGPTDWLDTTDEERIRVAYDFLIRACPNSTFVQQALQNIRLLHPDLS